MKAYKIFFILTSFLGVILIGVTDYSHIFSWGLGEVLALISTFFFSLSYIVRKWQSDELNNYEITQLTFLFAFCAVFFSSLINGDGLPTQHWNFLLLIPLLMAGLTNIFNLFLTNYGFQKVNIVFASNLLTLESAFAIIFGFTFYAEIPTLQALIGGLIIIISVIGMNTIEGKEETGKSLFQKIFSRTKAPKITQPEITS